MKKIPKGSVVYADSAYHSADISKMAKTRNLKTKIIKKGYRNKQLTEKENKINKSFSKVRVRVEHIFGNMKYFGANFLRSIGKSRIDCNIGISNLVYNMRRYAVYC